jgi:lactose/cellobiose-specific phosphotransferase system IIC component
MGKILQKHRLKAAFKHGYLRAKARLAHLVPKESLFYLREAMIWTLPCAIMSALFVAVASMLQLAGVLPDLAAALLSLNKTFSGLISIIAASALTYILSVKKRLPPMPVSLLALITMLVVKQMLIASSSKAESFMFIIAIAIAISFAVVHFVHQLSQKEWTKITNSDYAGANVKLALNLTIPSVIVFLMIFVVVSLCINFNSLIPFPNILNGATIGASYLGGVLYSSLNSILWFFGIHGGNILLPLTMQLNEAVAAGQGLAGETFFGAFVFIGGSGGTFSLILSILIFSRSKTLRMLAITSIPIALLNINELLLFGIPIILNPRLLVPFMIVPAVNVLVALTVIGFGWVATPSVDLSFTSLIGFNAYAATNHDFHAVLLQLFNIMLGSMIYTPFVKAIERESNKPINVYIKSLKITYTHFNEEASFLADDLVKDSNDLRNAQILKRQHIKQLAELDFYLQYQPQVAVDRQKFVGAEALLRARDKSGKTIMPFEFLPWLAEAGLMKSIDLWVADKALEQDRIWQEMGVNIPIKINITGETLGDKAATDELISTISPANGRISIEIIEQDFSDKILEVKDAIKRIHDFGGKVYIDDFGTGYSSLSYINSLNADYIKIDRSFVLALETEGGQKVMAGIFNFAEALGLALVVEGVETEEQLSKIPKNIPFIVQGWLYSKAIDPVYIPSFALKFSAA